MVRFEIGLRAHEQADGRWASFCKYPSAEAGDWCCLKASRKMHLGNRVIVWHRWEETGLADMDRRCNDSRARCLRISLEVWRVGLLAVL